MPLLEVKGLVKDFGGLRAVDHCSFGVEQGTITALIGPNGAGKTTVFNLITGLLHPTAGHIWFEGQEITGLPPHRIKALGIGRTFQIPRELPDLTVLENVILHAPQQGISNLFRSGISPHEREQAMALLEFVGLAGMAGQKAGRLSYGQKKLLELAAILMGKPRLILLDEPAAGVNPAFLEIILERIVELNRAGITFFVIEHNMEVVMSFSHFVIVMANGRVLTQGEPYQVQRDPKTLQAFLGGHDGSAED